MALGLIAVAAAMVAQSNHDLPKEIPECRCSCRVQEKIEPYTVDRVEAGFYLSLGGPDSAGVGADTTYTGAL